MRKYVNQLIEAFKDAKNLPDNGKSIPFPPAPPSAKDFGVTCKRLHANWRAYMIRKRYTPEQQAQLRQKVLARELLGGRRPFW